jgi:DNA repair protein RecN (Recombination protein N)
MLNELRIRNFAIIDQLHLTFGQGLNILTGETGAGKSIIIDAVGLLLGERATAEAVRAGSEVAEIEATFRLPEDLELADHLRHQMEEQGLDDPNSPEWVVLSREVRRSGRNICRVNGRSVSLQTLSELADLLVDVHGQGEHLNLLRPKTHVQLIDRFGGLLPLRREVAQQVAALRHIRSELQRLRQDARTLAQRVDLLSFQAGEIAAANLRAGEEQELESERRRLGNAETLMNLAQAAGAILLQEDAEIPGAVAMVSEAVGKLEKLARVDPDMSPTADEAQVLLEQLSDLARTLQDYAESLEFNPERLAEVEERLELIVSLKRKYGDTIEQINAYGARAQKELDELSNWEVRTADLEKQEEALLRAVGALGAKLSARRQETGTRLAREVEAELGDLKMTRARFGVAVEQVERPDGAYLPDGRRVAFDATGLDQVEFLISANPGEPLKPMARVASGGETARLMLALKSTLAHADATPTLIFDEIDQGIGGRVGAIVGQKLWLLTAPAPGMPAEAPHAGREAGGKGQDAAENGTGEGPGATAVSHQVLCITHLPQLAAFGDYHYAVNKRVFAAEGEERTGTIVRRLEGEDRLDELTQMLGASGSSGRRSVEEMMGEVGEVKAGRHRLK